MNLTYLIRREIKLVIVSIFCFLLAAFGLSYGFLTSDNNDLSTDLSVGSATFPLILSDNTTITETDIEPGDTFTKTITVENRGNRTVKYNLIWVELLNEIELQLSATCSSNIQGNTCSAIAAQTIPMHSTEANNDSIKQNISIAAGETHTYVITVKFKDEEYLEEDYGTVKNFYGKINIEEYEAPAATNVAYFEYEIENGEVTITGYNGPFEAAYDIDTDTCEAYVSAFGVNYAEIAQSFCAGTGVDPDDGETLEHWIVYGWVSPEEYEDWGLSNVNKIGTDIVMPSSIEGNPVVAIGDTAFLEMPITSIVFPSSLTSIGDSAFMYTDLNSVTIPENVTTIHEAAFSSTGTLSSVMIPIGVTSIETSAFANNALTSVTIPSSVMSIEENAFGGNRLTSVIIQGKSSSSDFTLYNNTHGNMWGWDENITCVPNNTSNVTNGCITWTGSGN